MGHENLPVILIEVVLVFGGVLLFAWWQLRSVARDQRRSAEQRERQREREQAAATAPPPAPIDSP